MKQEQTVVVSRTYVEETLAEILAKMLGIEQIDIHDNFFELGGESLKAIQIVSKVQEAFQVELPLRIFFSAQTVADLADAVMQAKREQVDYKDSAPLPTIRELTPDEKFQPFPLTDIQQAYWVGRSGAFELGNVMCHRYVEVESVGLDLERFNIAWQQLIQRHEMLRAVILPDGQQQVLERVPPYQIEVLDLRSLDPDLVTSQLMMVRQSMSHQVLRADQWPLFDIRAALLDEQRVRLYMSFDFLIADAWSFVILMRELCQLYQDPEILLTPLELSFRDYIMAEARLHDSELWQRSRDYWWNRLAKLPPGPELPLAGGAGPLTNPRFVRRSARLEPGTWYRLKFRATRASLTPSGALLAAFAEILTAWSKSPRFTVNLTLFNRLPLHTEVNDIVGDFTSSTLLATDNSIPDTFESRAQRIQKQLWDDLEHRYVSGVQVLRELARAQEGASRAVMPVVFNSTLNLSALGRDDPGLAGIGDVVYSITQTPQVWLDNQVSEEAGALIINWDAVEELFPQGLLDDMFDAYHHLLQCLADKAETWHEMPLQLVPQAQLEQRKAINASEMPITEDALHSLFAEQVRRRPRQTAVVAPNRTLTYEEIYRDSSRIGRQLRQSGAHINTLVAVVMEKGWEQVAAVLGILQSGAAYLPIDPKLPKERIWYLLENGEAELVLTQPHLNESLAWPDSVQRLCVDHDSLMALDATPIEPVQGCEHLAYVIYTSGSTGFPKGVMITHRQAVNTILDINRRFKVGPGDRVLALSSLGFDLSVYDIFGTLAAGGTIVIPGASATRDPAHWADLLTQERVTIWNSVPALMQMLVEYLIGMSRSLPRSLRLVLLSGDWIPVALPDQIKSLGDTVQVISLGGATEASIWSIFYPIEDTCSDWKSIPYGQPLTNQSFHVLNEALEHCPVWVPGQLYIGGTGLAEGYWRNEEKTRAAFTTHPRTGERLYRTGDLGRYLPDGNIEFLGREDSQVKIQGYRIELGEIEAVLLQHPGVSGVVATAVDKPRESKHIVAYVVPDHEPQPTSSELRNFLKEQLPEYMVPSAIVMLDAFPLTSNGKVNRKILPDLAQSPAEPPMREEAKSDVADIVAQIAQWIANILGIAHIDPNVNLLEYGVTSLDMIRIANQMERELGFRPNIERFYRDPTVARLAGLYREHQPQSQVSAERLYGT